MSSSPGGQREFNSILVYISSHVDNAIGENIMKLPMLRALRECFPGATISWIPGSGEPFFATILKPLVDGQIDEIISLPPQRKFGVPTVLEALWRRRFDLIIDTQHMPGYTLLLKSIRHRCFISRTWRFTFSDRRPPPGMPRSRHLVERLLTLVAAASGREVTPSPKAPLAPMWHDLARSVLPPGPTYVGLAPGAGRVDRGKLWSLENYIAVARIEAARGRVPVFLLGPGETHWLAALREAVPEAVFPGYFDLPLPPDLRTPPLTVAIGSLLSAAVSNCSGTGHMLAAGDCPMVSLFGPTNPVKYAPYASRVSILTAAAYGGGAIDVIPVADVVDALDAQVAVPRGSRARAPGGRTREPEARSA